MKRILLTAGILIMTGITSAQASRCQPIEVQQGCYTELGTPRPGWPHGAPYCNCPTAFDDINNNSSSSMTQPEVFDVILNFDGQRQSVHCCGGGHLPRECPCGD